MAGFTGKISQSVYFDAPPALVYKMLTDSELLADFTGSVALMDAAVGGTFDLFEGYCTGSTLDSTEHERLVQLWNFAEEGWPSDQFSTCTFLFNAEGDGTLLEFEQTGIPEHKVAALEAGWPRYFWEPMKQLSSNH